MDDTKSRDYLPLHKVLSVGVGNALEFYDFLTFSFFAIQIGHSFFPADQTSHGLLYSLATFGVGFLTRPLGGIVIGIYGDRVGRKPAMMLSFSLMGAALVGLALTPSYAQIGIAAPILLIVFRLVQGFALGGEVGPSTAYLIEAAPPLKRGLYVALQYATQDMAVMVAGLVGFTLSSWLTPEALDDWGWRSAFLLGTAVVPIGLYMRNSLPETLHAPEPVPVGGGRAVPVRLIVLALAMLAATTICSYVSDYITTYAQDSLKLATNAAFGATILTGLFGLTSDFLGGIASDRFGRKPVMLTGVALLAITVIPGYIAMDRWHDVAVVYGVTALLGLLQGFFTQPALVSITESLPRAVRSGALSILYALAISSFGGSTQFVIKWLIGATGSALAPAWYMTGALCVGAVAMVMVRETAPIRLR
jgi:MFS family permease